MPTVSIEAVGLPDQLLRSGPREAAIRPPHVAVADRTGGWAVNHEQLCRRGFHGRMHEECRQVDWFLNLLRARSKAEQLEVEI